MTARLSCGTLSGGWDLLVKGVAIFKSFQDGINSEFLGKREVPLSDSRGFSCQAQNEVSDPNS